MFTPFDFRFTGTVCDLAFLSKLVEGAHKVALSHDPICERNKPLLVFDVAISVDAKGKTSFSVTRKDSEDK